MSLLLEYRVSLVKVIYTMLALLHDITGGIIVHACMMDYAASVGIAYMTSC